MVHYFVNIFIFSSSADFSEVFRERPLKKLFGSLRGFSVYRAARAVLRIKFVYATMVKSRCRGRGDMERWYSCSFFTTFFLREKESGGKKSAHKRGRRWGCPHSRAYGRAGSPSYVSPPDCSADSETTRLYPKRSTLKELLRNSLARSSFAHSASCF